VYQNETMKVLFRFQSSDPLARSRAAIIGKCETSAALAALARRMLLWPVKQSISERRKDSKMAGKPGKSSTRNVKNLRLKSLSSEKAKQVKGGPCPGTNTSSLRFS